MVVTNGELKDYSQNSGFYDIDRKELTVAFIFMPLVKYHHYIILFIFVYTSSLINRILL